VPVTPLLVQSKSGSASSGSGVTVTLTSAATAGNCLVVCIGAVNQSSNPTVSGVTLGGSADNFAQVKGLNGSGICDAEIWADPGCAGGQASVAVSFTGGSGIGPWLAVWVMEWSGITAVSPADKTSSGSATSGTSFSSGSSGTLSQADELVIGTVMAMAGSGSETITGPGSPWAELSQISLLSNQVAMIAGYEVVSSAAAQAYSGTLAGSARYSAVIATFTGASSGQGLTVLARTRRRPVPLARAAPRRFVVTTPVTGAGTGHGAGSVPGGRITAEPAAQAAGHGSGGSPPVITVTSSDTGHGTFAGKLIHPSSDSAHGAGAVPGGKVTVRPAAQASGHAVFTGSNGVVTSADSGHGTGSGFFPFAKAATGHGAAAAARITINAAAAGHGTARALRAWPMAAGRGTGAARALTAWPAGHVTGTGTGDHVHIALASADTGHGTDAYGHLGVWTYLPPSWSLSRDQVVIRAVLHDGRVHVVARGPAMTGELLKLAALVSSGPVHLITSADRGHCAARFSEVAAVTLWLEPAARVAVWTGPWP
jgi:hypothetical protein